MGALYPLAPTWPRACLHVTCFSCLSLVSDHKSEVPTRLTFLKPIKQWQLYVPHAVALINCASCPHSVFIMYFVQISVYSTNRLIIYSGEAVCLLWGTTFPIGIHNVTIELTCTLLSILHLAMNRSINKSINFIVKQFYHISNSKKTQLHVLAYLKPSSSGFDLKELKW